METDNNVVIRRIVVLSPTISIAVVASGSHSFEPSFIELKLRNRIQPHRSHHELRQPLGTVALDRISFTS
jgi:hypothetical protein